MKSIFVGSSYEGRFQAEQVAALLTDCGVHAILWTEAFQNGDINFPRIEKLADMVAGAIFLATPDDRTVIRNREVMAPRANVLFEYGFFAARLSRSRVAIVRFLDTELPSDFSGLTYVPAGCWTPLAELDHHAKVRIRSWVEQLPPGNVHFPATRLLHGLSGIWDNRTTFRVWRRRLLAEPDFVRFSGKMMLQINHEGTDGWGFVWGDLQIAADNCYAEFQIGDSVDKIVLSGTGKLNMRSTSIFRTRARMEGTPSNPDGFDELLRGHRTFDSELSYHEDGKLLGSYTNIEGETVISDASELLVRFGF